MYGFREIFQNRLLMAIGIVLLSLALGVGTYVVMYQPSSGVSIQLGNKTAPPSQDEATGTIVPAAGPPLEISAGAPPASAREGATSTIPPRSAYTLKVQNAGGTQEKIDSILADAKRLGYQASPADVPGKALTKIVIRHKPGLAAVALRAAADLAPGATLEEHADISVDLVVSVGKT